MTLLALFLSYAIALSLALRQSGFSAGGATAAGAPRKLPSRILLIGATGGTGRQLLEQALERRFQVTALVRNPTRLELEHLSPYRRRFVLVRIGH